MKQVLYISNAARVMDDDELSSLLSEARENNKNHGITGVLFLVHGKFLQCIEGGAKEIDQLVENIRDDERNESFTVLSDRKIEQRAFPGWSMGFRTYSPEKFSRDEGFFNLDDEDYLNDVEARHGELIEMMRAFYKSV